MHASTSPADRAHVPVYPAAYEKLGVIQLPVAFAHLLAAEVPCVLQGATLWRRIKMDKIRKETPGYGGTITAVVGAAVFSPSPGASEGQSLPQGVRNDTGLFGPKDI